MSLKGLREDWESSGMRNDLNRTPSIWIGQNQEDCLGRGNRAAKLGREGSWCTLGWHVPLEVREPGIWGSGRKGEGWHSSRKRQGPDWRPFQLQQQE